MSRSSKKVTNEMQDTIANASKGELVEGDQSKVSSSLSISLKEPIAVDHGLLDDILKRLLKISPEIEVKDYYENGIRKTHTNVTESSVLECSKTQAIEQIEISTVNRKPYFEFLLKNRNFETVSAYGSGDEDEIVRFARDVDEIVTNAKPWYALFAKHTESITFILVGLALLLTFAGYPFGSAPAESGVKQAIELTEGQKALGLFAFVGAIFASLFGLSWVLKKLFPMSVFSLGQKRDKRKNLNNIHYLLLSAVVIPLIISLVF